MASARRLSWGQLSGILGSERPPEGTQAPGNLFVLSFTGPVLGCEIVVSRGAQPSSWGAKGVVGETDSNHTQIKVLLREDQKP